MKRIYTNIMNNALCLFDQKETILPTAQGVERLICVCLNRTGSSGYLRPGAAMGVTIGVVE